MSVAFEPRMTAVQFELCKVQAELFETACAKNYDMSVDRLKEDFSEANNNETTKEKESENAAD